MTRLFERTVWSSRQPSSDDCCWMIRLCVPTGCLFRQVSTGAGVVMTSVITHRRRWVTLRRYPLPPSIRSWSRPRESRVRTRALRGARTVERDFLVCFLLMASSDRRRSRNGGPCEASASIGLLGGLQACLSTTPRERSSSSESWMVCSTRSPSGGWGRNRGPLGGRSRMFGLARMNA